jgi:AraC-like DNA-binding protein
MPSLLQTDIKHMQGNFMEQQKDFIPPFHISTEDFPEKDRLAIWAEEFCRTVLKIEFEPIPGSRFFQAATLRKLPGLSMAAGETGGSRMSRTARQVAEGEGGLILIINQEGPAHFLQSGQEVTLASGQAVLLSNEHAGSTILPSVNRGIMMAVPSEALAGRQVSPPASLMPLIPQSTEALRLLTGYLSLFDAASTQPDPVSGLLGRAFVNHVYDLLALALEPARDTWERAKGGLRAARLHAIKTDILAQLAQSDLSVNAVAARQGVSPRYVQRLFEEEGTSFTAFVLDARLARAHRMLTDPGFTGHTIAAIAYEAGFPDLSNFNRFFRRRYSMTPSGVKAAAAKRNGGISES